MVCMTSVKVCFLAALFLEVSAFRVRRVKKKKAALAAVTAEPQPAASSFFFAPATQTVAQGEPGQVDFIFTLGAPGLASPGLQNQRGSNPCFQGLRIYNSEAGTWWGEWLDIVSRVGNFVFYWHAWYPSMKVDVDGHKHYHKACNFEETREPSTALSASVDLHAQEKYIESVENVMDSAYFTNISIFAARKGYMHDRDNVHELVRNFGWGLVGTAFHDGGDVYGGAQVTHLIQHPQTHECVLTFQGTASVQGWITNFHFASAHFCGLVEEDERCSFEWGTCEARGKGSFVHAGLKHRLMAMVQTSEFQRNILPNLGSCSRLTTVGHSLGGAVAEMFAACASKAPQPGQYGYDDYKHMAWTKGAPALLQYISSAPK